MNSSRRHDRGMSLLEVIIAAGIMVVVMMAFSTMIGNQQKETLALSEKLAILDFQGLMGKVLADGSVCKFDLTDSTIPANPGNPQNFTDTLPATPIPAIALNQIHSSTLGSPPPTFAVVGSSLTSTLKISKISIHNITKIAQKQYTAELQIEFSGGVRVMKPAIASLLLQTDGGVANPGKETVISCSMASETTLLSKGLCSPTTGPDNTSTYSCPAQAGYQLLTYEGVIPGVARTRSCCYIPPHKGQGWCSPVVESSMGGANTPVCAPSTADYKMGAYAGMLSGTAEYNTCCFAPVDTSATVAWCGPRVRADHYMSPCPTFPGFTTQRIDSVTFNVGRYFSCCFFPN